MRDTSKAWMSRVKVQLAAATDGMAFSAGSKGMVRTQCLVMLILTRGQTLATECHPSKSTRILSNTRNIKLQQGMIPTKRVR